MASMSWYKCICVLPVYMRIYIDYRQMDLGMRAMIQLICLKHIL